MNFGLAVGIIAIWGTGMLTGWLLHILLGKPEVRYISVPARRSTDAPE